MFTHEGDACRPVLESTCCCFDDVSGFEAFETAVSAVLLDCDRLCVLMVVSTRKQTVFLNNFHDFFITLNKWDLHINSSVWVDDK